MYYNFLIIAILFSLPGIVIWLCRKDLRVAIRRIVPLSLPFALTESFFFPDYWEPRFLFDLGPRIGFGIEDFIFVAGLAAFATTTYAFFNKKCYVPLEGYNIKVFIKRCVILFGMTLFLIAASTLLNIPMIYGSCAIMVLVTGTFMVQRRDLIVPACLGAVYTTALYYTISLLCLLPMPDLFHTVWHTEHFLNIMIGPVPLEELLYGCTAGFCATFVYPYLFGVAFCPLEEDKCMKK